jgi:hypothetical protein
MWAVPSSEVTARAGGCPGCARGMAWCCLLRSESRSVSRPKRRSSSEPRSTLVRASRWAGVRWSQCRPVSARASVRRRAGGRDAFRCLTTTDDFARWERVASRRSGVARPRGIPGAALGGTGAWIDGDAYGEGGSVASVAIFGFVEDAGYRSKVLRVRQAKWRPIFDAVLDVGTRVP